MKFKNLDNLKALNTFDEYKSKSSIKLNNQQYQQINSNMYQPVNSNDDNGVSIVSNIATKIFEIFK